MNYKRCLLWDKWGVIPFFLSQLRSILFHPPKKPECTFALLERFQLRFISIFRIFVALHAWIDAQLRIYEFCTILKLKPSCSSAYYVNPAVEQFISACLRLSWFFPLLFSALAQNTYLIFYVDELQLWSLNLCTQTAPLCFNLHRVHACVTACVAVTMSFAPCTQPGTHITYWDIGLASRVLHRSASPDSSLKCPWQPPNPQLLFPLCSCTFFSATQPLMDAAIFLCLSPLECSHNYRAL